MPLKDKVSTATPWCGHVIVNIAYVDISSCHVVPGIQEGGRKTDSFNKVLETCLKQATGKI